MEGFKVKCRTCGLVMYETTEYYNCLKPLTGDMLRLLPPYKDWPTYDGSLASKGTSRFLMFCSQCSGYISTTGKLDFADFPDNKVHVISEERSKLADSHNFHEAIASVCINVVRQTRCKIEGPIEVSENTDSPKAVDFEVATPEELMKRIEGEARTSIKKG